VFQGEITEGIRMIKFILIEYKYCYLVWVRGGVNQKSLKTMICGKYVSSMRGGSTRW